VESFRFRPSIRRKSKEKKQIFVLVAVAAGLVEGIEVAING